MEGRALRDRADDFEAAGCTIIGASFDSVAENKAFADAQRFPFPLLSDVERAVGRRYQVVRPDDDQYAAFPLRVSYLIDPAAVIRRAYSVTDVGDHAAAVLRDLADLQQ